jgi:hypothetical protein
MSLCRDVSSTFWFSCAYSSPFLRERDLYKYFNKLAYLLLLSSAVGTATGYGAGRPKGRSSSLGKVKNLLFSTMLRPAVGSTQLLMQWVPGGTTVEG